MRVIMIMAIIVGIGMSGFLSSIQDNLGQDKNIANNGYSKKCVFCNGTGFKGSFNCNQCKGSGRL